MQPSWPQNSLTSRYLSYTNFQFFPGSVKTRKIWSTRRHWTSYIVRAASHIWSAPEETHSRYANSVLLQTTGRAHSRK